MTHLDQNALQTLADDYTARIGWPNKLGMQVASCRDIAKALLAFHAECSATPAVEHAGRVEGLADRVRELEAENERLREALGNISRMRTLPDHKSNTFTLVAAHMLADQALNPNSKE